VKETPKYPGLEHQPVSGSGGGWFVQSVRRFLRAQFGNPTGFFGLIVGRIMARANVERIRWVVSLLGIRSHDRVLDVGCGPGVSIQMVSEIASEGFVAGIDHSAEMVRQATRRNAKGVASGRVALYEGSASNPPAFAERFDTIFTINSIHFWENPLECLKKLRNLLKPGGKIAVAIQPQSRTATDETTAIIAEEIAANLTLAGFSDCRVEIRKTSPAAALACILAKG
jgi:SAM-dependent methyltransferase